MNSPEEIFTVILLLFTSLVTTAGAGQKPQNSDSLDGYLLTTVLLEHAADDKEEY
jgi:hypothetical protein